MVKTKQKSTYVCGNCGQEYSKWQGKCNSCGEWDSVKEFKIQINTKDTKNIINNSILGYSGSSDSELKTINQISLIVRERIKTSIDEFNRVLGGGICHGSSILIGGHPGAGKSTILLQIVADLSNKYKVIYVTGEESLEQVVDRALRLKLDICEQNLYFLNETSVENIIKQCDIVKPTLLIIDSIQVMNLLHVTSSPGSISQVRESAVVLTRYAKMNNTSVIFVGHVTKDGTLAGPKVLEHVIDCSLMLESMSDSRYRILRSTKNRFGAINELGVFSMTEIGMKEVKNPSAIFLTKSDDPAPGSSIVVLWEGTRPLIVEIQSLLDDTPQGSNSRRISFGIDPNRLSILLAIMSKIGGVNVYNKDVYINVVGGIKISETSSDLTIIIAMLSSMLNKIIPRDLVIIGEVGLSGEIRPISLGQERLIEAEKHGFKTAIIPLMNKPKKSIGNMKIYAVKNIKEAFSALREILGN